ncbi:hypothetical protein CMI37_00970 [Candidatus Pacearchaeota archaeon]|nr:hypothetical protein [Candidatus Pacearchaeota archaeon]|tara:strand:+ start:438 stop:806 length:369 start_codon:yes stop_codon:yes gene_type:complete
MASFGVALPVTRNDVNGYTVIDDFKTLIKQNLKMLILTAPGERVMTPNFGVGVRNYLFQNVGSEVFSEIENKIREQVKRYLSGVTILQVKFDSTGIDRNTLGLSIFYSVSDIGITDLLKFTI